MSEPDGALRFPELALPGDSRQRGHAHGETLRTAIVEVLDYYRNLFGVSTERLLDEARQFATIIRSFSQDYADEIEAIAAAAGQDPLLIYALNSRSEILNNVTVAECTSIFSSERRVLAQNWDWSDTLERLLFLARIEGKDGLRSATLTEPGILGKIGLNNRGIGATLNILKCPGDLRGLPVHVLLRAILDCDSLGAVERLVDRVSVGKASHVLVGCSSGRHLSLEFAGTRVFSLPLQDGVLVHTNHYLAGEAGAMADAFPTTHERYTQAVDRLSDGVTTDRIASVLRDQSRDVESVCRPYSLSETPGFGEVGTVFTVLMDLTATTMQVYRGPDPATQAYRVVP